MTANSSEEAIQHGVTGDLRRRSSLLSSNGNKDLKRHSLKGAEPNEFPNITVQLASLPDRYNLALFMLGVLGFSSLLPWCFYCTASEYYDYQLRDRASGKPSELAIAYESSITVANCAIGLACSVLNTYLTTRISFQKRIHASLIVMVFVFGFSAAIAAVSTDNWQVGFFAVTLICLVIASAAGSIVSSAALGVASILPPAYITSVLIGMGVAGVFTSLASIIAIAVSSDPVYAGLIYFVIATLASLGAIGVFVAFNRLAFVKHYVHIRQAKSMDVNNKVIVEQRQINITDSYVEKAPPGSSRLNEMLQLLRLVWPYCLSMTLTFFLTLTVFPAIMVRVSGTLAPGRKYFVPIYCFLVFNVGDVLGRYIFQLVQYPRITNRRTPLIVNVLAVLRFAFIPLFLLCNVHPRGYESSIVFGDWWFVVFSALLALSNGYIKNLSSMYPPQIAPPDLMETCGSLLITAMYLGLLGGGAASFLLLYVVKQI